MTGIPDRIEILKLAASLLPSDPQATVRSRIADALSIAALLEDGLLAGQSLDALSSTLVPLLSRKPSDGTLSLLSTPVDRLSDLGQQVEHGILVRRDGVRKGVEQAGDEALAGKFPVGVGRHDESSPVCGVEADRLEDAGDGVMSSPDIAAGPDDFDTALAQRHGERLEIVTGQSGVSGYCKKTEAVNGTDDMPQILASVATLTRLSVPVTEEERAAFSALPPHARADILARILEAMRVLYRTKSDGVYFVFAAPVRGFNPQTFCLTEGPDGARHKLPAYETPWQP
ncbi:hypothetical protein [Komagataeibacter europaeus]|uniref:hypothetical protein n=1 Tax=Komagataeibacter europaeus TaxID=33995 RepID=UPI00066231EA|nr:hypothetical protein [Komagataeibacter europaeus]